jgi:surface antigen
MPLLRRVLVLLAAVLAVSAVSAVPASAAGGAYPWRLDQTWSSDQYGFTKRQCVSFVAWRTAQRGHVVSNHRQRWGNAGDWDNAARRLGVGIGSRPVVGAVAHWNTGESSPVYSTQNARLTGWMRAGAYGHVGYVEKVYANGSVLLSHYNGDGRRGFALQRVRAPRYLYVGVAAPR